MPRRPVLPSTNTQGSALSPTPSRLSANPPSSVSSATGKVLSTKQSNASFNDATSTVDDHGNSQVKESKTIRVKVATLSPTPHHPKVVGMLKVPFPLIDLDFSPSLPGGVVLRKRVAGKTPEPFVSPGSSPPFFLPTLHRLILHHRWRRRQRRTSKRVHINGGRDQRCCLC